MTVIEEKDAKYQIKSLIGQKIKSIKFSEEPKVDDLLTQLETTNKAPSEKTEYYLPSGQVYVELESGVILSFWNTDAGGMVASTRRELGLPVDQVDDLFEFTEVENA